VAARISPSQLEMAMRLWGAGVLGVCVLTLAWAPVHAQGQAPAAQAEVPADTLGRDTPRGTVVGFLAAARNGQDDVATEYLNTRARPAQATALARQLFVVLDTRLPARIAAVSDEPDGSRANPLAPGREVVGTIRSAGGPVDVVLERVTRANRPVWLFSEATLRSVPALHEDVTSGWSEDVLPGFLTATRVGGIRLFEWIAALLGVPFFYLLTVLLNRILTPLVRRISPRLTSHSAIHKREALPAPVRLLILAFAIRWFLAALPFPLIVRQFWATLGVLFTIAGIVWLLILLSGEAERYIRRRVPRSGVAAAATLVRLGRRFVDLLVIFAGLLAVLRYFGVDPTPALAGLGVGGIAVALAAQKTLENVIAGASLIFDQAVRVGDVLKVGTVQGTVDHIGLRSTRIRTPDRTVVSVPNGQIANMSLETLSARDKFWFHPRISIRAETLPAQLHAVVDGIRRLLDEHPSIDRHTVRVRFIALGTFSLDVDVSAYVIARDWDHFLEVQEQLLFGVTDIVEAAGTQIAFHPPAMFPAREEVS
jgi:MscS family membrane protein